MFFSTPGVLVTMNIGRFFYRIFIYNYKIKLFCLLSAIFFWLYINLDNQYEHDFDVPLYFVNLSKDYMLLNSVPSSVKVRFRGSGRAFLGFRFRDRKMIINLSEIPNNSQLPLTLDMIHDIPSELNVKPIAIVAPKTIFLRWVKIAERKVPVIPRIQCQLEDGYTQVGKIQLNPDSVVIRGPKIYVDTVQWVVTEAKTFTRVKRKVEGNISLQRTSSHVFVSEKTVKFWVDVQRIGEKIIFEVPVRLLHLPENVEASVKPEVANVTLQGGVEILSRLEKEDVRLFIDYATLNPDSLEHIVPEVELPNGILSYRLEPSSFEVIIKN